MNNKTKNSLMIFTAAACFLVFTALLLGCGGGDGSSSGFTVTFDLGYSGATGAPQSVTVEPGETLGEAFPAPQRNNYDFIGWFDGVTEYKDDTPINGSVKLTARWARYLTQEESEVADLFEDEDFELATPLKDFGHGNPLMTQDFGADPNVLVWNNRVYVYMTADTLLRDGNGKVVSYDYGTIKSFRVLSSADLANWTHHPDLKITDIQGTKTHIANLWAPALVAKTIGGQEKIFLYFSNGGAGTGVISATYPLGPWESPRSSNIVTSSTQNLQSVGKAVNNPFDPGVLLDTDGRAYLYIGGATPGGGAADQYTSNHPRPQNMRVFELQADMVNLVDNSMRLLDVPFTFEASEINKINGRYYYSYSSNPQVNTYKNMPDTAPDNSGQTAAQIRANAELNGESLSIGYAISNSPMPNEDGSGFVLTGMILKNPSSYFTKSDGSPIPGNNNHHRIFQFQGRWYIVYHTKILQVAWDEHIEEINEGWNYRSTSIDTVTINSDGTIKQVEGTRTGVQQVGSFNPYQSTDASTMAVMAGIKTAEYSGAAGKAMKVTGIDSGDWLALRGVQFGSNGATKFKCRVTPPASGTGAIQIRQGGLDGPVVGYVIVESGQTEITVDLLRTVIGLQNLVFVFHGSGWDFEQWQFVQ